MRFRITATLVASLPLVAAGAPAEPPPRLPAISVQVLEEAWKVGDEKTYTLEFDRAPIGREAMRLLSITERDGVREALFRQRLTLDLRALGQEGRLEHSGTLVHRSDRSGPYRYEEVVTGGHRYQTYRDPGALDDAITVTLDPVAGTWQATGRRGTGGPLPLPAAGDALLVDFLLLPHWESVFAARRRWELGEGQPVRLLIPAPPQRFDFHRPVTGPRPVEPQLLTAQITVEAAETIELFGAHVETFRCRVDPPGLSLWVTAHGGVLRFDDGHGLTGALEP